MPSEKSLQVELDLEACTGHGRCYELAPEIFGEDEHGHCVLLQSLVPPELADSAIRAVANCPERALGLLEDATRESAVGRSDP